MSSILRPWEAIGEAGKVFWERLSKKHNNWAEIAREKFVAVQRVADLASIRHSWVVPLPWSVVYFFCLPCEALAPSQHSEMDNDSSDVAADYKLPAQKTIDELLNADAGDESLEKYKRTLLGSQPTEIVVNPNDTRTVLVQSVELIVEGRDPIKMDLSSPEKLSDLVFNVKEGATYRLKFSFYVQREIVSGLKYAHKVKRAAITVDSDKYMMGSYAPKNELQFYMSPPEEAPSGALHRGKYKVHSKISDDDDKVYLQWDWIMNFGKDW
ncbi:unnamed protein product [Caenorhabditis auriculariae]|uniref:Rho GDP-dissociation inhibitor 1 n=1 Tax=Caenorhabditis auriculariae TaxID=2777116 RepID=A0A8S1H0T1_9PELO|nr:unnamed protein product [Caenorhabditis auriculariae]